MVSEANKVPTRNHSPSSILLPFSSTAAHGHSEDRERLPKRLPFFLSIIFVFFFLSITGLHPPSSSSSILNISLIPLPFSFSNPQSSRNALVQRGTHLPTICPQVFGVRGYHFIRRISFSSSAVILLNLPNYLCLVLPAAAMVSDSGSSPYPTSTGRPSMWTLSGQRKLSRLYTYTNLRTTEILRVIGFLGTSNTGETPGYVNALCHRHPWRFSTPLLTVQTTDKIP